jgi:hypothetical protein
MMPMMSTTIGARQRVVLRIGDLGGGGTTLL